MNKVRRPRKRDFRSTLKMLRSYAREHDQQSELIDRIYKAISAGKGVEFEVRHQCFLPNQIAIKSADPKISVAMEKANENWKRHNDGHHSQAEVFVRFGELMIPLLPRDAARIASSENGKQFSPEHFTVDERMTPPVGKFVRHSHGDLPGWHA